MADLKRLEVPNARSESDLPIDKNWNCVYMADSSAHTTSDFRCEQSSQLTSGDLNGCSQGSYGEGDGEYGDVREKLTRLSEVFHRRVNNEAIQYGYQVQKLFADDAITNSVVTDFRGESALVSHDVASGQGNCVVDSENASVSTMFIEHQKLKCLLKSFVLASSTSRNLNRLLIERK